MDILFVLIGLGLLTVGADLLVRGAIALSLKLGVSALIVGLTVVAFGTSAPELLVSIDAVLDNKPGLAIGNAVGSNIANILLVLGVPAVIACLMDRNPDTQKNYKYMVIATILFTGLAYFTGVFNVITGAVLLAGLALFLSLSYRDGRRDMRQQKTDTPAAHAVEVEGVTAKEAGWKVAVFIIAGVAMLPLGATFLVDGASSIARTFGVSNEVIGLTLVAIGTSLPELATSIAAALRKQTDVAVGNVLGSNIFNLLAIIGAASMVGNITVTPAMMDNIWIMCAVTILLGVFVMGRKPITRPIGAVFTLSYAAYTAYAVAHA